MSKTNPLLCFKELPHFADITPENVAEAVDTVLNDAQQRVAAIIADTTAANWESVLQPLEIVYEKISRTWNQVEHMRSVMSSPAWCAAHQENLNKISAYFAHLGQNAALYQKIRELAQGEAFTQLPAVRQKIITDTLRDFELSGVGLSADKKEPFRKNSERLAALAAKFEEHLLAATQDFFLLIEEAQELGDMPADLRAIAADAAQQHEQQGYRFTLKPPSYLAFMQYVTNRSQRQKMYYAYVTRASELGATERDNTPLVSEILQRRQQQAELLGFSSYAEVALQTRMAPSADAVLDFLRDLAERAKPFAEAEIAALKEFAASELALDSLAVWDVAYAAEKLRRARFDFSEADLRPYLREDKILSGLFSCLQQLFGITLRPMPASQVSVWQQDVQLMELCNTDGKVIGAVYLDLYARDNKRSGAWMAEALSRFYRHEGLQLPVAHVVCNFSKPVSGAALLNFDEVVTLFHEFGHAMHHLLTEINEYSASGIAGVEWDAVELPSQWLENFAWEWQVLENMTAHCDSGEPMPKSLFEKAVAARRFHSGLWLMRQLEFALFDMALHDGKSLNGNDVAAILQQVRQYTAVLPAPDYNRFYCGFSHIFAGGYAAGYYSYLWAEVLAADVFMLFKKSDTILNRTLGEQFRQQVLAVGGSRKAMDSFIAMCGREPQVAPLLAHHGLGA